MKPEELEEALYAKFAKMEEIYKEEIDRLYTEADKELTAFLIDQSAQNKK